MPIRIFLIEDNPGDVFLVKEALKLHLAQGFELTTADDGESAANILDRFGSEGAPCPDIILLDLNLPKSEGSELLARIKAHTHCKDLPVVVLTSSDSPRDRATVSELGARLYFRKPSDLDEFLRIGEIVSGLVKPKNAVASSPILNS